MQKKAEQRSDKQRFENLLAIANNIRESQENPALSLPSISELNFMLLENALSEVKGSSGSVMLHDPGEDALMISTSLGIEHAIADSTRIGPGSETISRKVFDTGIPLYVSDVVKSQLKLPTYDPKSSGSFMSMPLVTLEGVRGVVNINAEKGNQFKPVDFSYGMLLATYMGVVMSKYQAVGAPDREDRDKRTYRIALDGFVDALRAKSEWVYQHSIRVREYSLAIADTMGIKQHKYLGDAARLHDVGKVATPDDILNKDDYLTDEEYDIMKDHPVVSQLIASIVDTNGLGKAARQHHQHWDGGNGDSRPRSYPDEDVWGEGIHPFARIIAVADTLEAMTRERPYRAAFPMEVAIKEIGRKSGSQFDPDVAKATVETYKAGGFGPN